MKYALDIGSYSSRILAAKINSDNLQIEGSVSQPTEGYFAGVITDNRKLLFSLLELIRELERKGSKRPKKIILNCSNSQSRFCRLKESFRRHAPEHPLSIRELQAYKEHILKEKISLNEKEIFIQIDEYKIDEQKGIVNPEGMTAKNIEVILSVITIPLTVYNNIFSLFSEMSIEIEAFLPEIIGKAELILSPENKKSGVMLLDIGWGEIKIAVFKNGTLKAMNIFESNLKSTFEIFQSIYHLNFEELEKIFQDSLITEEKEFLVQTKDDMKNVSVANIQSIAGKNIKRLLYSVRKYMDEENILHLLGEGVIITGGKILEYPDFHNLARLILRQPVRIVKKAVPSLSSEFATAYGMLQYIFLKEKKKFREESNLNLIKKIGFKISSIIERYF